MGNFYAHNKTDPAIPGQADELKLLVNLGDVRRCQIYAWTASPTRAQVRGDFRKTDFGEL